MCPLWNFLQSQILDKGPDFDLQIQKRTKKRQDLIRILS